MPNLDFVGPHRAECDAIAENGWEGFAIEGVAPPRPATRSSREPLAPSERGHP